ncbi:helix-turn-helix domain-containing protein [Massilia cavernae]|uniref:helix-turn-helix domain-containing protein n=1 Tax=Massilia cavernae TaxID=2320864 RepID=UPI001E4B0370|nr:helix-turn-helix domain-containing protein [Massilia cavernae]
MPDNHGIPGKTLAAAREALGWSVEQIADQLKMAVRQVVALEAGDYAALPGPAVVRGFVRAYAKVVKLDPVPLVAQIALDAPEAGINGSVRPNRPTSFTQTRFPSHGKRGKLPVMPIAIAVIAAAAAVGAWQFGFVPGMNRGATQPAATGDAGIATLPVPANGSAVTAPAMQDPSVPLISVPPPATPGTSGGASAPVTNSPVQGVTPPPAAVAPAPAATAPVVTAPAATAPAAAAPGANALVLQVREDSWVEVRNASGKPLIRRMVKGGGSATVDITDSSTVIVGNPSAVTATLRGAEVALPPQPGKTFSRVKVQ